MNIQQITDFRVSPHFPYTPLLGKVIETGGTPRGVLNPFAVKVPCNIYDELIKAGYIADPRVGMNSMQCEWVSQRWWLYEGEFTPLKKGGCSLVFEGVDYRCRVFLNGEPLGIHEGSLTPFSFEVGDKLRYGKTNLLRVLVENVPEGMGQIGYTDKSGFQRPRFDYKWDFCTRMVNIGIYRPVYLDFHGGSKIKGLSFKTTDALACKGYVEVETESVNPCDLKVVLNDGDNTLSEKTLSVPVGDSKVRVPVEVKNGAAWYPAGVGESKCYRLIAKTVKDGKTLCEREQIVGFRDIRLEKNERSPEGSLGYTFTVNGKRLYAKGFNLTPLDQMLGTDTRERWRKMLQAASDAHANFVRVWGGGVIEQPCFYELCSEMGLMVWQDMIQSSSGLCSVPSTEEKFLAQLCESAQYFASARPNYPCLAVVCGGNELFGEDGRPVTFGHPNIAAIEKIFKRECPEIAFLPSTSSGPTQEADLVNSDNNHDIHGPWLHTGEKLYEHYNKLKCLFAGEFGCHGMASMDELERILPPESLRVTDMDEDIVWRHHGDWWDVKFPVEELFGKIHDLPTYVRISQKLQYDGLLYGISSLRRQAFRQSGCNIWQLNEAWPCVASTTLIDYYGNKKLAYYAAQKGYDDVLLSFEYAKTAYKPGETVCVKAFVTSDLPERRFDVSYKLYTDGALTKHGVWSASAGDGKTAPLSELAFSAPQCNSTVLSLETAAGEKTYTGEVMFLIKNKDGLCSFESFLGRESVTKLQNV